MSWFDVAETADGHSYSVSTRRTGTTALRASAANRIPPGRFFDAADWPPEPVGFLANLIFRDGRWTVLVAPWYGQRGKRWKVRLPTEAEADHRAYALCELIRTHQWDPRLEPPPKPASEVG
jgi:hypothetical protein